MAINTLGKVIIVDEDPNITSLLSVNLRSEGYDTVVFDNATTPVADDFVGAKLVIADIRPGQTNRPTLLKLLKSNPLTTNIGFIVCSDIDSERTIIACLDAGADDYIVKPFSLRELVARAKAVIRRHSTQNAASNSSNLQFKTLQVDLLTGRVADGDNVLSLTKTEYAILEMLIRNIDNYVSRATIYQKVWKDDPTKVNVRIVDTNISRLRKKLGDISQNLINRTGLGYMLKS